MKFILLTFLLISGVASSQITDYYEYSKDVTFIVTKIREQKKGAFEYRPLRGFTSYIFHLTFQNHSNGATYQVNLEDIFLANPKTKRKFELVWYNNAGIGGKAKPTFEIYPGSVRRMIVYYMFDLNEQPYFLVNDKLSEINLSELK